MKFISIKFWQILALISGSIIAVVMALASISYSGTLGTTEPAFALVPISNRSIFEGLALAFDLGMVASVFGFWHWLKSNRVAAAFCAILFVIASAFSIHSVRGYIAINITKTLAPLERNKDIYVSLKTDLTQAQKHLADLQSSLLKSRGRKRTRLSREIRQQSRKIHVSRKILAQSKVSAYVPPMWGLEWFLSGILWFFNATCWTAWFGTKLGAGTNIKIRDRDSVNDWLTAYHGKNSEHCTVLFDAYSNWCRQHSCTPLVRYSFYARLIELGAEKFRKNGNGATFYKLPQIASQNDMMGE